MFDLSDAVIIIPVRIDQPQRQVNLERTVAFLGAHLKTQIYVIEQDATQKVPWASEFVRDGDTFHKTSLFNRAVQATSHSVLFFLDVDVLVDPEAYARAYTQLQENRSDLCLLYTRGNPQYTYTNVDPSVLEGHPPTEWMPLLSALTTGITAQCEGGIVAFRRDAFFTCGRFNERFIGYGQEDTELILRARRFGLRYEELPFSIYHQAHDTLYMTTSIKRDHISQHIHTYTRTQPLDRLAQELTPTHPKYVTLTPSGGRLGNVLFELASLFQYARMTCRSPSMPIPSAYRDFLAPLERRMTPPFSGTLSRKRVDAMDAGSAVFYTEFPLVYDDVYVHELSGGYLQSPDLFRDVRWMFQDLLGSKDAPHPETKVMLHVRRGDYAKYPFTYEQLGEVYYTRAMAHMKRLIPMCTFVLFTDEPDAVRHLSYFNRPDVEIFNDTGLSATAVLQEMTRYSSFVLANSTFGLWGALLSQHAKTVIAPMHWTRHDTSNCLGFWNTIYEPSWIRISNRPITIRTETDQFAVLAPASEDAPADLALVTSIPEVRPNAKIVALITNDVGPCAANARPDTVDYLFSTTLDHVNVPHPSWTKRPIVFVGPPGTLWHFHYLQSVTETLLESPKVSIFMFGGGDIRPGSIFQSLNSLYLQTERSWEIVYPSPLTITSPVGEYLFSRLAIPKLLCVVPTSPTIFHGAAQARADILAYSSARCLSFPTRLEHQLQGLNPAIIVATHYMDEGNQPSMMPAAIGSRISTLPDISRARNTFLFYRKLLNASYWFDSDTLIRFVSPAKVRFFSELYSWKPGRHLTTQTGEVPMGSVKTGPLANSQSSLVSGLNRNDSRRTQGLRAFRSEWIGEVELQKRASGLKYLL